MTEVYISIDNLEFTKLDLSKDEAILMKYTQKDLQDISKIFAPYSQNFNFPATPKNRMAFGFFGDTEIIKVNTDKKYFCKIYTNGVLNLSGFVVLSDLSYKNSIPQDFTGNFTTSMLNLKDRIGDDLINNLAPTGAVIDWTLPNVFSFLKTIQTKVVDSINVKYFVPLISNNRVWSFNNNTDLPLKDNIAYDPDVAPNLNNIIQSTELRPCVSFSSIMDMIIKKYNLSITCPLFLRKEYTDLYVYCTNEFIYSTTATKLTVKNVLGSLDFRDSRNEDGIPDPKKYTVTTDVSNGYFKVTKRAEPFTNSSNYIEKAFNFKVKLTGVVVTGGSSTTTATVTLKRKTTGELLVTNDFDLVGSTIDCTLRVNDTLFLGADIEFDVHISFNQPLYWSNCAYRVEFRYYDAKTGGLSGREIATYFYESLTNNNSGDIQSTNIDLFRSLPEIKCVDFLSSFFKAFNISVFDTSPNDENLFWLTPSDIQTSGQTYSKATLDYTPYVDISSYKKSVPSDYNYYNFKHATSKYKSSIDYLTATGLEYGQVTNPAIKPSNPKEFKVETNFSLMTPVLIEGTSGILTHYGFTNDTPEILETGETRYTPNFGELTVFYSHGSQLLPNELGYRNIDGAGAYINSKLDYSIPVAPYNDEDYSFGFSVLVDYDLKPYPINLYLSGYDRQTLRLLDTNVLSHDFTFDLPSNEIYLNESTTVAGGLTPSGFRLQNDIIVGETLFTIVDASIDITTGKAQMILLNTTFEFTQETEPIVLIPDPPAEGEPTTTTDFYYSGIYNFGDGNYSEGGIVTYKDIDDVTQIESGLFSQECRKITALYIISVSGATPCFPVTE